MAQRQGPAPLDPAFSGQPAKYYDANYESHLLRGVEDPRPWNIIARIEQYLKPGFRLLDIGCGTAFKIIPLGKFVQEVVGLEPSEPMRIKATQNAEEAGLTNFSVVDGIAAKLPFEDESFDIVTNILSPDNADEILRVLKPGGFAILEKLGDQDKSKLKSFFGSDENGPRGKFGDVPNGERRQTFEQIYRERFREVDIKEGYWNTYLTPEGLRFLLNTNSDVRSFNAEKDAATLRKIERELKAPRGIVMVQHRLLLTVRK